MGSFWSSSTWLVVIVCVATAALILIVVSGVAYAAGGGRETASLGRAAYSGDWDEVARPSAPFDFMMVSNPRGRPEKRIHSFISSAASTEAAPESLTPFEMNDDDDDDEVTNPFISIDGLLREYLFGGAKAGKERVAETPLLIEGVPAGSATLELEEISVSEISDPEELREVWAAALEELQPQKIIIVQ